MLDNLFGKKNEDEEVENNIDEIKKDDEIQKGEIE